jgi:hypothetical protein
MELNGGYRGSTRIFPGKLRESSGIQRGPSRTFPWRAGSSRHLSFKNIQVFKRMHRKGGTDGNGRICPFRRASARSVQSVDLAVAVLGAPATAEECSMSVAHRPFRP